MDRKEQIRKGLQELASKHGPLNSVLAQVLNVDEEAGTCTLDDDGLEMFDVRLKPVLTEDEGVVMFPAVESWVLVARIEGDEEWLVVAAEKIDKYRITVGECVLEMSEDGFEMKKGTVSLKNILSTLTTEVIGIAAAKNVAALTQVKTKIENLFS